MGKNKAPGIWKARDRRHFSNILYGGIEKAQNRNFSFISNIIINNIIINFIIIIIVVKRTYSSVVAWRMCGSAREPTAA